MGMNIPMHYVREYATILNMLLQQKGSRLRGSVMEQTHIGEQASPVDQVGAIEMQAVTQRFAPMGRVDAPLDRRWVFPQPFDLPQLVDKFDELKLLIDPKSKYVENAVAAAGRQIDRKIIDAFFGVSATGQQGSTPVSFPGGQVIPVNFGSAGNSGLTVKKLREARKRLMAANVDMDSEELHIAVDAKTHDDLLAEAQVTSGDYNSKLVLTDGKINSFLGYKFHHTELLLKASGNVRLPVWVKSGIHLGIWGDIKTSISQRHDLQGEPWQAYVYLTIGATRLEEQRVVEIVALAS